MLRQMLTSPTCSLEMRFLLLLLLLLLPLQDSPVGEEGKCSCQEDSI